MSSNPQPSSSSMLPPVMPMAVADTSKKKKLCPTLALLTNPDEVIMNGRSRNRFPDPVHDRSILLACYDTEQNMIKIRHGKRTGKNNCDSILKTRFDMEPINKEFYISDESSSYFLCLDSIQVFDGDGLKKDISDNVMMADIRDHSVAGKCLPDGVTGYWVRLFGPKRRYSLLFSMWKSKPKEASDKGKSHRNPLSNNVIKIAEKSIVIWNSGKEGKPKKHKSRKKIPGLGKVLRENELRGSDHTPTFCTKEKYCHILTSLRECLENAKYEQFEELYNNFSCGLQELGNRDNVELKLFLWCERSQFYAVQGNFPEAKKLLQKVVDNVVPKSPNKSLILNRAYLFLANTHVMEGNNGTAEECLSVIQPDKKNGMPYDDMCMFELLRAIILMNFGKQLPRLSHFLWEESRTSFAACETNFLKALPLMFNQHCRMHLNLGRLLMCQFAAAKNDVTLDIPMQRISILEGYGLDKLSLHIKCLLGIVKSELFYHLKQPDKGNVHLNEAQEMAEKLKFREECILIEQIRQSWNELQYQDFLDTLEKTPQSRVTSESYVGSDLYIADESSN